MEETSPESEDCEQEESEESDDCESEDEVDGMNAVPDVAHARKGGFKQQHIKEFWYLFPEVALLRGMCERIVRYVSECIPVSWAPLYMIRLNMIGTGET